MSGGESEAAADDADDEGRLAGGCEPTVGDERREKKGLALSAEVDLDLARGCNCS